MKKTIFKIIGVLLLIALIIIALNFKKLKRVYNVIHLFDKEVIVDNFQHMDNIFEVTRLSPSSNPSIIPKKISYRLPATFTSLDSTINITAFLDHTLHEGMMIIHHDTIIYEDYQRGLTETETHISWSMAKSVIATLIGIAYQDGLFKLEEPVTKYLSQFKNTGYDEVRIKDILQMSSGVKFNEDYGDFNSDINRLGRATAAGTSLEDFAKSLVREREPGTYCKYVSIDTQVLGILLKKLTGKTMTQYLNEKLWQPMGMQDHAEFIIDNVGLELALGGLNMTMRDYAKLGLLYLHEGYYNGRQIVDSSWVHAAVTPDAPHLMPGLNPMSSHTNGYGYQWWIPEQDDGDFFAAGIYNQYIYIQPKKELVIVNLSANYHFKERGPYYKVLFIDMFKEIAQGM
jgi:CubicO group peptidase (beta-lactamase class C family)